MKLNFKMSQCMIVKNEEKDIERALTWGKDLMYEQIVVDTGSTDRTVEIAKKLGAKVYHFEWINDFAAAKNFAISKASGDWIAFLDADEYILKIDKLVELCNDTEKKRQDGLRVDALRLRIYNLDDNNVAKTGGLSDRFFVNDPNIRYVGKIHESVQRIDGEQFYVIDSEEVPILHTGYQTETMNLKEKNDRNFIILQEEYEKNPMDLHTCFYLAIEYMDRDDGKDKAIMLLKRVIANINSSDIKLLHAISLLIGLYSETKKPKKYKEDVIKLYRKYRATGRANPDIELYMGHYFVKIGLKDEALEFYEVSVEMLNKVDDREAVTRSFTELSRTYYNIAALYQEKKQLDKTIHYLVLSLKIKPYQIQGTRTMLQMFKDNKENISGVIGFLGTLYQMDLFKDKAYIIAIAREIGYMELVDSLLQQMSETERVAVSNFTLG